MAVSLSRSASETKSFSALVSVDQAPITKATKQLFGSHSGGFGSQPSEFLGHRPHYGRRPATDPVTS